MDNFFIFFTSAESSDLVKTGLVSLISAGFGALVAFLLSRHSQKRQARSDAAKHVLELVSRFENECLQYWCRDRQSKEDPDSVIAEETMQAFHMHLRHYMKYANLGLRSDESERARELISKLFDEATGPPFGSKERAASRARMQKIARLCAQLSSVFIPKSFQ